ncbi:hypothetical protein AB1Y20_009866 [Prymnesium parvum]|uniref:Uncharacterized protein n=1 Tax=Prymnesium parvum TaxID=97485 RepID=A0AB34K5N1_PRYPA
MLVARSNHAAARDMNLDEATTPIVGDVQECAVAHDLEGREVSTRNGCYSNRHWPSFAREQVDLPVSTVADDHRASAIGRMLRHKVAEMPVGTEDPSSTEDALGNGRDATPCSSLMGDCAFPQAADCQHAHERLAVEVNDEPEQMHLA